MAVTDADTYSLLNGAWRELNGIRAIIDYNSVINGSLVFLPFSAGMLIDNYTVYSITYANIIVLMFLLPWAFAVSWKRMSVINSLFYTFFVGLLVIGTYPLGHSPWYHMVGYENLYYRYGYALLSIFIIEVFLSPHGEEKHNLYDGFSSGLILAMLLFFRLDFFLVALLLFIGGFLLHNYSDIIIVAF